MTWCHWAPNFRFIIVGKAYKMYFSELQVLMPWRDFGLVVSLKAIKLCWQQTNRAGIKAVIGKGVTP